MSQTPIRIVEWTPEWQAAFADERDQIRAAVGDRLDVEHIGSTAVPGLAAKPIIDIMAGAETLAVAEQCIEPLEAIGYDYQPELEAAMPNRRYFRKTADGRHTHHLHVVERGGEFWDRHLCFREYLRANDDVARRYGDLKRELAERHRDDIAAYTEAKTEFIEQILERARREDDGPE